jgi:tripartite-type tricarboxylate transporter receptor subunit TctC
MKTSVLMLSAVMGLNGLAAFGQGYPSRPIRAVIPYAPGGVSDLVLRSLSDPLAQRLGQPIVIENRGGGGGTVAAGQVARAAADGHLVMLGTGGNLAMAPSLYKSLSYDPQKDFAPIAMVARGQLVLVVHPSVPASSVRELVNLARTRPGQLNYASSGVGSPLHLAMELFKSLTHTEIVHVPYKGSAPMLADLAGGQVDIGFDSIATSLPHMQSGRLKGVAVSGEARSLAAPDLPTMAEAGVPGFKVTSFYAFVAPAATPKPIVERLSGAITALASSAEVRNRLVSAGLDPDVVASDQLGEVLRREQVFWAHVVRTAGIAPQ